MEFRRYPVGQTDRQTDTQTHRQTYSSQYFATALAGEEKATENTKRYASEALGF